MRQLCRKLTDSAIDVLFPAKRIGFVHNNILRNKLCFEASKKQNVKPNSINAWIMFKSGEFIERGPDPAYMQFRINRILCAS